MTDPHTQPQSDELLQSSRWRPLHRMLDAMDQDIASLYTDAGIAGVRPRFVGPLIQLGRRGPMTIQELARAIEVTHSAMSQTAAAMGKSGLVEQAEGGPDRRTRRIQLSDRGRELAPFLEAEWRATEVAVRDLEAELPYSLARVVEDIQAALAERSFKQRLSDNLAAALQGRLR